jgi:aspartyl/glutamyl-tRNA(Asn/Gln) amidotransferase C subunit
MKQKQGITIDIVKKLGLLARLPLTGATLEKLLKDITSSLAYIDTIQTLKTDNVPETSQVTGLENVLREDVVELSRTLTQEEVLSTAKNHHDVLKKAPAIFEQS